MDSTYMAYFWAILVIVIGIIVAVVSYRAAGQRHLAAKQWAALNGCVYMPNNPAITSYFKGRPFIGGFTAKVSDFIEGKTPKGHTFCSFQYSYVVSTGKSSTTVYVAVAAIRLPSALPQLTVSNESIGGKIAQFFGGKDIQLESDDFNNEFRVQSDNEAFAYGVLTPQTMESLMGPVRDLVPFAIKGADLICWRTGYPDYMTLGGQLAAMDALVGAIPQGVYEQYARPAPAQYWWTPGVTVGQLKASPLRNLYRPLQ